MKIEQTEGGLENWFKAKVLGATQQEMVRVVEESIEYGAEVMRHNIENRGTDKSGKRGRIDTGAMLAAVDSRMVERSSSRVVGEFGWVDEDENYFLYQDRGFRHYPDGQMVEPMLALQDAYDETVQNIREDFGREL